jgi:diguanylate cyclase (GGDEF)-like protein
MRRKDSRLWAYTFALLALVAWLASTLPPVLAPAVPAWLLLLFPVLQLLVWQNGFPAPAMGMLSMERVPQIAVLCLFPVPLAALLNAAPALLWPFVNRHYRSDSWSLAALRALHNAGMIWLMSWVAGSVYAVMGGALPLRALDAAVLLPLLALALLLQLVNSTMIIAYYALDGRDVRQLLTPGYLLLDLLFVPFGILLALVVANNGVDVLLLFLALVLLFVVSLRSLHESRAQVQSRLETLDAVSRYRPGAVAASRLDGALEGLCQRVRALFRYRLLFIALHDAEARRIDKRIEEVDGVRQPPCSWPDDTGLVSAVLGSGEPLLIDDWNEVPEAQRQRAVLQPGEQPGCVLMAPVKLGERVLGVLSIQHPTPFFYSKADKNALLALAENAAPLIADAQTFDELEAYRQRLEDRVHERTGELERSLAQNAVLLDEVRLKSALLERQSREDSLTGIANRRCFDERLQTEIERAERYGEALSLLLIDLDHFKCINDSLGHAGGDQVLRETAVLLRARLRQSDLAARIGGEEFALLLPCQDVHGAEAVAEQLREGFAAHDFATGQGDRLRVTLSAGIAQWRAGQTRDGLLRRADQALYRAKAEGRNRVVRAID